MVAHAPHMINTASQDFFRVQISMFSGLQRLCCAHFVDYFCSDSAKFVRISECSVRSFCYCPHAIHPCITQPRRAFQRVCLHFPWCCSIIFSVNFFFLFLFPPEVHTQADDVSPLSRILPVASYAQVVQITVSDSRLTSFVIVKPPQAHRRAILHRTLVLIGCLN